MVLSAPAESLVLKAPVPSVSARNTASKKKGQGGKKRLVASHLVVATLAASSKTTCKGRYTETDIFPKDDSAFAGRRDGDGSL